MVEEWLVLGGGGAIPIAMSVAIHWEVLQGVGVDGVGGFFFVFLLFFFPFNVSCFLGFFLHFSLTSRHSPRTWAADDGQSTAICWNNGELHSDPVCTDPVQNFPNLGRRRTFDLENSPKKKTQNTLRNVGQMRDRSDLA